MSYSSSVLFKLLCCDLSVYLPTYGVGRLYKAASKRDIMRPEGSKKEFACLSLAESLFKKFEDEVDDGAEARALAKFIGCNEK